MFTPESLARAAEYLRRYNSPGPFVLTPDGVLGIMQGPNFHEIQGGPDVQIGQAAEELEAAATAKARESLESDAAAYRAMMASKEKPAG